MSQERDQRESHLATGPRPPARELTELGARGLGVCRRVLSRRSMVQHWQAAHNFAALTPASTTQFQVRGSLAKAGRRRAARPRQQWHGERRRHHEQQGPMPHVWSSVRPLWPNTSSYSVKPSSETLLTKPPPCSLSRCFSATPSEDMQIRKNLGGPVEFSDL